MHKDGDKNKSNVRKMSKDKLLHLSNNLFEQAVDANSFLCILKQYEENSKKYHDEVFCSPAFYSIVYCSLTSTLLLLLSKLYDRDSKSLTLDRLLKGMEEMTEDDLEQKVRTSYELCGGRFQHQLKPFEEHFYEDAVREQKQILEMLEFEYHGTVVDLSLKECVQLYRKRLHDLRKKKIVDNLITHRNRIIAHNDFETNFNIEKVFSDFPLSFEDIEMLLEFALDCTQFVREILTGTHTVPEYVNIDDWEITLQLTRIGTKYKETYINECLDAYSKE